MTDKKKNGLSVKNHKIEGHSVQIRKSDKQEQILIDGVEKKYFVNEAGFVLHENIYARPQKTLLAAAKLQLLSKLKSSSKKKGA